MRFIDNSSGELLSPEFGRCDREQNCRYFRKPEMETDYRTTIIDHNPPYISHMSHDLVQASMSKGLSSNLTIWLSGLFGEEKVANAAREYKLGQSRRWDGATVFWQVDISNRVRTGKIMLYDCNGKRVKDPFSHISWAHSVLKIPNYNLKQCFFGEHLIPQRPDATIAIVESEKTAVIASLFVPEMIWIATGGKNGCIWKDTSVSNVLSGRRVVMFPDLGAFDDWENAANHLAKSHISISTTLEEFASEQDKEKGLDIADYLIELHSDNMKKTEFGDSSGLIDDSEIWDIDPF